MADASDAPTLAQRIGRILANPGAALSSAMAPAQATAAPQMTMSQTQFGNPNAPGPGIVPMAPPVSGVSPNAAAQVGSQGMLGQGIAYQRYMENAMSNGVTPMPMGAWMASQRR